MTDTTATDTFHIAQINIASFVLPKDDPVNADFVAALDSVNAIADASDGFIWRLVDEAADPAYVARVAIDPHFIINMSVWRDVAALEAFAYRQPEHRAVLMRKREWFKPLSPSFALWRVPVGHIPDVAEGLSMLEHLAAHGPDDVVFNFASHAAARAASSV